MVRTTPPRPVDVLAVIPELAAFRRVTTRLHPRCGTPTARDSSIGGPLLWPADEPWPVCRIAHSIPNPLVAAAQLFAADVPTIGFPDGKDLLQVLWCPNFHMDLPGQPHYGGPAVQLFWRRAEQVGPVLADPPRPHAVEDDFFQPRPCVLHPEQAVEYQYANLLPPELRRQIEAADQRWWAEGKLSYFSDLSIAPGSKAGGWARWNLTDFWERTCAACGADFDLLVQLSFDEWDAGTGWKPIEDDADDDKARLAGNLGPGHWGLTRVFVCSADITHPYQLNIQ